MKNLKMILHTNDSCTRGEFQSRSEVATVQAHRHIYNDTHTQRDTHTQNIGRPRHRDKRPKELHEIASSDPIIRIALF